MLRDKQNIGSVVQVQAGNISGVVANAADAHRPVLTHSPGLRKRSTAMRMRRTDPTGCPDTWPGGSVLTTELAREPESFPAPARPAGSPPAAIWASLILSRAMSS